MSIFAKLKSDGFEETQDRLGGFQVRETDIYTGPIKMAYAGSSKGGAQNVTLILDLPGGSEYRETIYITNKKGENWFVNKDDPTKRVALPGFTVMDDICTVTSGKGLAEQDTEAKMVKVYDPDQKKEVPKSVPVLVELLGLTVSLGIGKLLENKTKLEGNEYVPTAEERSSNVIEKVFHTETKMTCAEARQGLSEGVFWDAWLERNKGKERDKRTIKDGQGGAAGAPVATKSSNGAPVAGGQAGATRPSLFGAKKAA
ncbi:hypothetical protein [Roseococcus sp.]|uniref:hypothetical protein n=1 Tax=Roseococcus sp. TaxID=2109646 RepID=UPI003BAA278D